MFFDKIFAYMEKKQYFCIVFFMVLDLRLMEIGLSGDNPSFFLCIFLACEYIFCKNVHFVRGLIVV